MKLVFTEISKIFFRLLNFINSIFDSSRADKLLIAAFVVAVLRQMGVNAHLVGFDPVSEWDWFQPVEVYSGIAMALLLGIALAYVARKWRGIKPETWTDWVYWGILLIGMLVVFISEIFYTALYAYATQRGATVSTIFSPAVNMLWNITVAGVLPLLAIMLGIVDDGEGSVEVTQQSDVDEYEEGWLTLIDLLKSGHSSVSPRELSAESHISMNAAEQVVKEAYKLNILL